MIFITIDLLFAEFTMKSLSINFFISNICFDLSKGECPNCTVISARYILKNTTLEWHPIMVDRKIVQNTPFRFLFQNIFDIQFFWRSFSAVKFRYYNSFQLQLNFCFTSIVSIFSLIIFVGAIPPSWLVDTPSACFLISFWKQASNIFQWIV